MCKYQNIKTINKDLSKAQIITKDKNIKAIGVSLTFKLKEQKQLDAKNSWKKTGEVLANATGEVVTNTGGSKEDAKKVANVVEKGFEDSLDNYVNNKLGIIPTKKTTEV